MAAGWGIDPTLNASGTPISGTSAQDVRKVWGALYAPGIITGAQVVPSTSNMTLTVTEGVVVIPIVTGENVIAPVPRTTLNLTPQASGTRSEFVYVQQFTPTSGSSDVQVKIGSGTLPPNSFKLRSFIVGVGSNANAAALPTGGIDYSIPYGASGKVLYDATDTSNATFNDTVQTFGTKQINLPTDRKVQFSLTATLSAEGAYRFDDTKYCEARYRPTINGNSPWVWGTPGLHQAWSTYQFEGYIDLTQGVHTIALRYYRGIGPGLPNRHYSGADQWPGTRMVLRDAGPIV